MPFQFYQPQCLFFESNCCPHSVPLALAKKKKHINSKITSYPLKRWWWIQCQAKPASPVDSWMWCTQSESLASSVFRSSTFLISSATTEYWKLCLPHTAQCIWYQLNSFQNRKRGNCIITRSSVVVAMETSVGGVLCCTLCCTPSLVLSPLLLPTLSVLLSATSAQLSFLLIRSNLSARFLCSDGFASTCFSVRAAQSHYVQSL